MIIVFGKGKVGNGIKHLLDVLKKDCIVMDDQDWDPTLLDTADMIIVSPGIKQSHGIYQTYRTKIQSELCFLWNLLPELGFAERLKWIGITATNGKSTTTWVAYNVFKHMFPEKKVWITWNFDVPVSEVLAQIIEQNQTDAEHILVVECSSFMLYHLHNFEFDYSIVLNIAKDHLDWHKDWDEYRDSKLNLLRCTTSCWVAPQELFAYIDTSIHHRIKVLPNHFDLSKTNFLGKHNMGNLAAVQLLVDAYVADMHLDSVVYWSAFDKALKTIQPLDHRLKLLRKLGDVNIYDDGICTSSHSLSAALESFEDKVVLVAGGYDKGDDYVRLQDLFAHHVGYAVLMWQTASKFEFVCVQAGVPYVIVDSLHEGIQLAYEKTHDLNLKTLLYSPWAASFDMFKNVYHRVEEFEKEISFLS